MKLRTIDQIIPIFKIRPEIDRHDKIMRHEQRIQIQIQNHWRAVLNQTTSRCSPSRNPFEVLSRPCTPSNMAPDAEQETTLSLSYLHTWHYLVPPWTNSVRSAASHAPAHTLPSTQPMPPASPLMWNDAHHVPIDLAKQIILDRQHDLPSSHLQGYQGEFFASTLIDHIADVPSVWTRLV